MQGTALTPEAVTVTLRDNLSVATVDGDGNPLPEFSGHIYSDENGEFPVASQSSWETEVIRTEIDGRALSAGTAIHPGRHLLRSASRI